MADGRIDVHAHYWTDAYLDMLVELGKTDTATQRNIGASDGVELDLFAPGWRAADDSATRR